MTIRDKTLFAENASPEAIQVHLTKARAAARKAQRQVTWLEGLLEHRTAQIAAGTWPTTQAINGQDRQPEEQR